jgi:hypothetical protein
VFLDWNPSAVSDVTASAEKAALTSMEQPGETFAVTGNTTWYAVWAVDADGNGIPDYNQAIITYQKGALTVTVAGLPKTQAIPKNTPVTVTKMGISVSNYTIIGWHTSSMPPVANSTIATLVKAAPTFYAVDSSFITSASTVTLYAVWAIDKNNNGKADYDENGTTPSSTGTGTRSGISAQDSGISLRSGEYPSFWDPDYDQPALDDRIYCTGCIYNADYDEEFRENLILLNPVCFFDTAKVYPLVEMDFVIEYGGVLTDKSLIGGARQKPLDKISITTDMIGRGFSADSLINYDPIMFNSIKEDGQGILKMYFVKAGTKVLAERADFSTVSTWTQPFKDPETGEFTDTLVIKFNIYNKPAFKPETISLYTDIHGKIRLDQVSGTSDKYMMRSINGRNWRLASDPLSDMEQLSIGDGVSIVLREMDKTIAYQKFLGEFYLSDAFNPYSNVGGGLDYGNALYDKYYNA